jgi:sulfoxide reductase heme-binding subunit YedZ
MHAPASEIQQRWIKRVKPVAFTACLVPGVLLIWRAATDALGAEPIEAITLTTGDWALRMLLITLTVTPLRQLTGWHTLIRLRQMFGLYAFFYASLHFLTYIVLDQFFAWQFIIEDIAERPYILVGFSAFVLLIPLAATSTNRMLQRLGGKRWQRLHRLAYIVPILGVLHFLWLVKADITEPAIYALILTVLLGYRVVRARRRRASQTVADMAKRATP